MKRNQVITLIFFVLTLAITTRVGTGLQSKVSKYITTSFPEVYDSGNYVLATLTSVFYSDPCENGRSALVKSTNS